MKPSIYQQAIFDFVSQQRGSAIVAAVAGSGKTTTIVECASIIPAHLSAAFVAFNKSIVNELKAKLPKHVKGTTLNGMGFSSLCRYAGTNWRPVVDDKKTYQLSLDIIPNHHLPIYGPTARKLVGLAKGAGLFPASLANHPDFRGCISLTNDTDVAWQTMLEHHAMEWEEDGTNEQGFAYCRAILAKGVETWREKIDFDDQLYLPVVFRARFWQNHFIFVDEAQDVNKIQRAMLKRALLPGGRLIAVGDPWQAIYGFRGADSDALSLIQNDFGTVTLPLSISYRCPQAVVREAQKFCLDIQASPTAPIGRVDNLWNYDHTVFTSKDAIICRQTKPLVDMAYRLIRKHVGCKVLGREIGQGLITLINKMKAKKIDDLVAKLRDYREREEAKFIAKGQEPQAEALADKCETITILIENLPEGRSERTVKKLIANIESLFGEKAEGVLTLCTIHKSKGLEWPRVFILEPGLMPSKYARQAWQQRQEVNIQYVAVTRAKEELYYINLEDMKKC
jgi:DNA helicase-2/ATP-dependent DNA helicase PcrA